MNMTMLPPALGFAIGLSIGIAVKMTPDARGIVAGVLISIAILMLFRSKSKEPCDRFVLIALDEFSKMAARGMILPQIRNMMEEGKDG
jgi:uncharacterized membrane protein YfcA